jgi:hypothetical protein
VLSFALSLLILIAPSQAHAQDQILYTSKPDELAIFLNDIAFARDEINLPSGVAVRVILPSTIYPNTLIVWENGERVSNYRLNQLDGQTTLQWQSASDTDVNVVQLEYLMRGISWQPKYDMWITDETKVSLDFFAEITNTALVLDDVEVRLIAGSVDTAQQIDAVTTITMNQYFAGYEENAPAPIPSELGTGSTNIQYVYSVDNVTAIAGDVIYTSISQNEFSARQVLVWNASESNQIDSIYKVRNDGEIPLAQGTVRSYQNNLFLGSDFIELTPIGGEGSVTVGNFQNARVNREEVQTYIENSSYFDDYSQDTRHEVELTLTSFAEEVITVEVADYFPVGANTFEFSVEPDETQGGNFFRWTVTLQPNETITIAYEYLD